MTIVWPGTEAGNISMQTQFVNQYCYAMTERGVYGMTHSGQAT
jgi:hypothetical protein